MFLLVSLEFRNDVHFLNMSTTRNRLITMRSVSLAKNLIMRTRQRVISQFGDLLDRSLDRHFDCSLPRSLDRSIDRSLDHSIAIALTDSLAPSLDDSIARHLARSVDRSMDHSLDRSIVRSLDRSIAQSSTVLYSGGYQRIAAYTIV